MENINRILPRKEEDVFALVDCNNFYVSCERAFKPCLKNRPVAVLSNNDGCVVARSPEVKKMGVRMGAPLFENKKLFDREGVAVFSSNYELYGDMSRRVMEVLQTFTDEIEIYSIDEAFLTIKSLRRGSGKDYLKLGRDIKERVLKWTGIPVSVGIGPTKTLAKAANELSKQHGYYRGVLSFCGGFTGQSEEQNEKRTKDQISATKASDLLKLLPVGDVWGIGPRYSKKLNSVGVKNAFQFTQLPDNYVKDQMTVMGLRTKLELLGISCIPLEILRSSKKGIVSSRSFGQLVKDKQALREAVSYYTTRACEKLRSQNSKARRIEVFIMTNRFREKDKQYYGSKHRQLTAYSNSTAHFIKEALWCLDKLYRPGFNYKKAGIYIFDIAPEESGQVPLFDADVLNKASLISKVVDRINSLYGKEAVTFASSGVRKKWSMRREMRSDRFTTSWDGLLAVG